MIIKRCRKKINKIQYSFMIKKKTKTKPLYKLGTEENILSLKMGICEKHLSVTPYLMLESGYFTCTMVDKKVCVSPTTTTHTLVSMQIFKGSSGHYNKERK